MGDIETPDDIQCRKSEMIKVKELKRGSYNRCSYYTDIEFAVDNRDKKIAAKIDTVKIVIADL